MTTLPPFDDSRKALSFALNLSELDVRTPRPAMNKAMAEGVRKAQTKAQAKREERARRLRAAQDPLSGPEPAQDVLAGTRRGNPAAEARAAARDRWLGLDGPSQAGLILLEFGKLDAEHRVVLTGLVTRSAVPCSCRSACCSGWAQVPRWTRAVADTCQMLKETMDVARVPGKRGLSTPPDLRRAVVEAFYTKREATLVDLSELAGVSTTTAAKHRAWILEALERIENEGWLQVDAMFDAAGITGTIIK